jgi:hypothetical protein
MKINIFLVMVVVLFLTACNGGTKEVPIDSFVGMWELKGRSMFDGIQIRIEKHGDQFSGKIIKVNDNKLVTMFAGNGDVWVSGIERTSNFQFKLTEKKLAKDLFSLYGLSTSQEFKVEFIDHNTIGLAADSSDPQHAAITYNRVE